MAYYRPFEVFDDDGKREEIKLKLLGAKITPPFDHIMLDAAQANLPAYTINWDRSTIAKVGTELYAIKGESNCEHDMSNTTYQIYGFYFVYDDGGDRSYLGYLLLDVPIAFSKSLPILEVPISILISK